MHRQSLGQVIMFTLWFEGLWIDSIWKTQNWHPHPYPPPSLKEEKKNLMVTTVSYPYVWCTCGNVDSFCLLNQHCHRSSGSDMVSGEREMKTEKKAQLMTSSYASVHLLMSFQGEAGKAGAKAEPGCERPGPSLPCCDPCLPTHKEPQLPATNEC